MKFLPLLLVAMLMFSSCQQEIDWGLNNSSDNEKLVKILRISTDNQDTNTIIYTYDAQGRIAVYKSTGRLNGVTYNYTQTVSRAADGKITRVHIDDPLAGLDSFDLYPQYVAGKLDHIIDTQFFPSFKLRDSTKIILNASGQLTERISYSFPTASPTALGKQVFAYDATGNPKTVHSYRSVPPTGFQHELTSTYSYDSHKSAANFGEESIIFLGIDHAAKNFATKEEVVTVAGPSTTVTIVGQTFNNANRPKQSAWTVMPGATSFRVQYFYQ